MPGPPDPENRGANVSPPAPGDAGGGGAQGPGGFQVDPATQAILDQLLGSSSTTKAVDPTVSAGERAYFQIWGVKPPHGYIQALAKQGLNVHEIIANELAKPGARKTSFYRDVYAKFAAQAASVMGMR